jgi:hypothetical protein
MQFNSYNHIYEQRWPFLYVNYYVVNYIAVYLNYQSIQFLEKNCIVKEKDHKNLLTLYSKTSFSSERAESLNINLG